VTEPGPVRVVVDPDSGLAPWRQVRDQLRGLIGSGALAAGTRLPAVRQFARDLGLAPGTIARAYRELEQAGLLRTARARGTVVADTAALATADTTTDVATDTAGAPPDPLHLLARDYLARAGELGADPGAAVAAVRRAAGG
jgi:GntR family transcriptional regulator